MPDIKCPAPNCDTSWPSTTAPEVLIKLLEIHERTAHPAPSPTTAPTATGVKAEKATTVHETQVYSGSPGYIDSQGATQAYTGPAPPLPPPDWGYVQPLPPPPADESGATIAERILAFISVPVAGIGVILLIVTLNSDYWMGNSVIHFSICYMRACEEHWEKAVSALIIIGMLAVLAGMGLLVVFVCIGTMRKLLIFGGIAYLIGGFFTMAGVIHYLGNTYDRIGSTVHLRRIVEDIQGTTFTGHVYPGHKVQVPGGVFATRIYLAGPLYLQWAFYLTVFTGILFLALGLFIIVLGNVFKKK